MHLKRIGAWFVAATVLLAIAGNAAVAQEHDIYRCKVADVVTWDDDGSLRLNSNPPDWIRQFYDGMIIDTLTGVATYSDGVRMTWSIVQQGDDRESDYVLVQPKPPRFGPDHIRASAATHFIRIRTSQKPMPTVRFLAFDESSFASGPCEVVR